MPPFVVDEGSKAFPTHRWGLVSVAEINLPRFHGRLNLRLAAAKMVPLGRLSDEFFYSADSRSARLWFCATISSDQSTKSL